MTAQAFLASATNVLAQFKHKDGCFEAPDIVSHPMTGQLGMACKACKRLVVITNVDKAPVVAPGDDDERPVPAVPRFKA
jgi:hypothetical protein